MEDLQTLKSTELISLRMDMAEVWEPSPEWYRKEKQIEATIADKLGVESKEVEQKLNIKKRKKRKVTKKIR